MEIKRYNIVRNTCWKCLIECNVRTLPTPLGEICTHYGIGIVNDSDVKLLREDESGRIVCVSNTIRIIVNDRHPIQRRRYTIAHELGHYLLGHLGTDVSQLNRRRQSIKSDEEIEADTFAARLLAPACVLWALDLHTADEIAGLCNMSVQAASYRAERMKKLYQKNNFLKSPLERKVYEQFKPFIKENTRY